jgi:4-amino-4-deoxy-L-arabinose transferase-like glycosyltransferase
MLALILGVSVFFRFYNLANLFNFSLDEEVIAFHVQRITTLKHFPLIGVNAAGTGLYLGPLYFYAAAPFFALLHNDALAGALFASSLGVVTTLVMYWLGVVIFSKRVGLILSLLHAASLSLSLFERKFFNPTPMTLVIALIFIALHKLTQKESKSMRSSQLKYAILLGGCLGLLFHINLSLLWLIPFAFFWLVTTSKLKKKEWFVLLLSLSLLLLPLFVFELRHDWLQTRALAALTQGARDLENPETPYYWGFPFTLGAKMLLMRVSNFTISDEMASCAQAVKNSFHWFGILVALASGAIAFKKPNNHSVKLVFTGMLFGLVSLLLYPGRVQEYYAFSLAVPMLGLIAHGVNELGKRTHAGVTIGVLGILVVANLWQLVNLKHPYSLEAKKQAAQVIISLTKAREYSFFESGNTCSGFGLVYILHQANHAPASSFADSILGWLYDKQSKPIEQAKTSVTASFDAQNISIKTNEAESKSF